MTSPSFDKGPGEPDPQPYGSPAGYVQPGGDGTPGGYASPGGFGEPGGYGTPYGAAPGSAPYGAPAGGVVGPDGSWQGPALASWGQRFLGYLLDTVLAGVLGFVIGLAVGPSSALPQLVNVLVLVGYGYMNGALGQTPGKKAVGIKLLRVADGQLLGAGAGIGRQFLHILDALPLLLGFLWPIWDKKNQTFADKIIGSVVVKV